MDGKCSPKALRGCALGRRNDLPASAGAAAGEEISRCHGTTYLSIPGGKHKLSLCSGALQVVCQRIFPLLDPIKPSCYVEILDQD